MVILRVITLSVTPTLRLYFLTYIGLRVADEDEVLRVLGDLDGDGECVGVLVLGVAVLGEWSAWSAWGAWGERRVSGGKAAGERVERKGKVGRVSKGAGA